MQKGNNKIKKKIIAIVTALMMVICLIPADAAVVFAASTTTTISLNKEYRADITKDSSAVYKFTPSQTAVYELAPFVSSFNDSETAFCLYDSDGTLLANERTTYYYLKKGKTYKFSYEMLPDATDTSATLGFVMKKTDINYKSCFKIEDGVWTEIADRALLTMVPLEIPEGVTEIANDIWSTNNSFYCGSVFFPSTMKSESIRLPYMKARKNIVGYHIDENNEEYKTVDGAVYDAEGTRLLVFPAGLGRSVETIKLNTDPESIAAYAFEECQLNNIVLPDSVKNIGTYSFQYSTVKNITFGSGLEYISQGAFEECKRLSSVTLPEALQTVEYSAFSNSGVKKLTINSEHVNLYDDAFSDCNNLSSFAVGDKCTNYKVVNGVLYELDDWGELNYIKYYPANKKGSFEIPEGIWLSYNAFSNANGITELIIPAEYNGDIRNDGMDGLKSFTVEKGNDTYFSRDGVLYMYQYDCYDIEDNYCSGPALYLYPVKRDDKKLTIEEDISIIANYAFHTRGVDRTIKEIYVHDDLAFEGEDIFSSSEDDGHVVYDFPELSLNGSEDSQAYKYYEEYGSDYNLLWNTSVADDGDTDDDSDSKSEYLPVEDVEAPIDTSKNSMTLFEKCGGYLNNKVLAEVFPADYSIEFPSVPVQLSHESQMDGTYVLKMAIGLDKMPGDRYWKSLKEDIEDYDKSLKRAKALAKKYNGKEKVFDLDRDKFLEKPKFSAIGYFEMVYDQNGKVISDSGGIVGTVKFDTSVNQQCIAPFTPPIPYYVELGGKISGSGSLEITTDLKNSSTKLGGKFTIDPGFYAESGAGISGVATVGVKGSGDMSIQLIPATKGSIAAGIAITAEVAYIVDEEYNLAKATYPLWDTTGKKSSKAVPSTSTKGDTGLEGFELVDRYYQENTTKWNGDLNSKRSTKSQNGITFTALQEYVLPNTIPQMEKVGDDTVMVFQSNAADRATQNGVRLMYSVYDGDNWSVPKALWDNGSLDTFADIEVINDELYVVWQKCKNVVTETDVTALTKKVALGSEICYSKYDESGNSFNAASYVTNNNVYDYLPKLVDDYGTPAVLWINSDSDDILGIEGTKTVMMSSLDSGKWSAAEELSSTDDYISEMAGVYKGGQLYAAYLTTDADNNQKLYVTDGGSAVTAAEPAGTAISGLKNNCGRLLYNQDGIMKEYDPSADTVTDIKAGSATTVSANAVYVTGYDKTSMIWMSNDETGCTLYSSVETENGFSEPVEVYSDDSIRGKYFTAVMGDNDNWEVVLNAEDIDDASKTSMYFLTKDAAPKVEVTGLLVGDNIEDESGQMVSYVLKNDSEETITSYYLSITGDDGTVISKTLDCELLPGEELYVEETLEAENPEELSEIVIKAMAEGQIDTTDATASQEINLTDLELTVAKSVGYDYVEYTATVTNTGQTPVGGTLKLYADNEKKNLIASEDVYEIEPGDTAEVTMELPLGEMDFDSEGAAYSMICLEGDYEENNAENNVYYGATYTSEFGSELFDMANSDVTLAKTSYTYTGKLIKPAVTVEMAAQELTAGEDYGVTYSNNKYPGTATVKVTGKGIYSGTVSKTFKIKAPSLAAPTNLKSNLSGYNDYKVSWKKVSGATGYYVQYKMYGAKKFSTKKSVIGTSYKKADLKAGKRYAFKVTPYAKINGKIYTGKSKTSSYVYTLKKLNRPKVTKLSRTKVKIKWNNIYGETGYQIGYSKKKNGKYTIKTYKTTTAKYKVIKFKKSGKRYYKVRAYKVVNGKKIFGPWSKTRYK